MEIVIGIGIWVVIFVVWYCRTYPGKVQSFLSAYRVSLSRRRRTRPDAVHIKHAAGKDFRSLVETVESICARDRFGSSDAATMVDAVKKVMEMEPSSGQIWEAYALDSLETAKISCDDCKIPVEKTIKKTGVRIHCPQCRKWLALKNSKVTVIDPGRADLDDWEH
jgi:hypothetical protein